MRGDRNHRRRDEDYSWRDSRGRRDTQEEDRRWYETEEEDGDTPFQSDYISPELAADERANVLLELQWKYQLPATYAGVVCVYASTAGAIGLCKDLANHPDKRHFQ